MTISKKLPAWMAAVEKLPGKCRGAKGDEFVEAVQLAQEAWGLKGHDYGPTGVLAFGYLFRRFGPPTWGSDPHKDIAGYILGTPKAGVYLTVNPAASDVALGVGYLASQSIQENMDKPIRAWVGKMSAFAKKNGTTFYGLWDEGNEATLKKAFKTIGHRPTAPRGKWQKAVPAVRATNRALLAALAELLRPVFVRDVPINVLGPCECPEGISEAVESPVAGYGCRSLAPKDRGA